MKRGLISQRAGTFTEGLRFRVDLARNKLHQTTLGLSFKTKLLGRNGLYTIYYLLFFFFFTFSSVFRRLWKLSQCLYENQLMVDQIILYTTRNLKTLLEGNMGRYFQIKLWTTLWIALSGRGSLGFKTSAQKREHLPKW